ncbi:MAG TPA: hypothetical protein DD417_18925 [Elusimicrobia bacterium]|nr:hypothetical protein [Elusimicrobiota bacterium]
MQQQVNEKAGVTFESLLKIAMRQDPDVIFLGEIRDAASAKAALDLASTGHLTISTMHTTNAASAVFRLERLGISRAILAESLLCVVAQKLVRRLCPRCAREAPAAEEERRLLAPFAIAPPPLVRRPQGCAACGGSGYLGREAVCEIMDCDPPVAERIRSGEPIGGIRRFIRERGDFTIVDHALDKVRRGIASLPDACAEVFAEELDLYSRGGGAAEPPTAAAAAQGGRRAILLVDDDANTRELLRAYLQGAGCEVACAEDGVRALLELGSRRFDLVLSDMNMPQLDGMKLLEMVRQKGFPIPVLLMTADSAAGVEEECLRHGAADFIRKPIDKEVLLLRVRRALAQAPLAAPPASRAQGS